MTHSATEKPSYLAEFGYYPFGRFLRTVFPYKVYKVTIDAGFTCPNRDGTRGEGGCTYCINESFSPNTKRRHLSVTEQMQNGMSVMRGMFGAEKFIAYFQAYSNTYAPINVLRKAYDEALDLSDVVGLSVGTRPDCVDKEKIAMLADYATEKLVFVEYGLQSMHDVTLRRINRGHTYREFLDAVHATAGKGMKICIHVILGLPGETPEMMMQTAEALAKLPIDSLKLHHLYVAEYTVMAEEYARGKITPLSAQQYIKLTCDFLERIPAHISIQRLVGELDSPILIAPKWKLDKQQILGMIIKEFKQRKTYQGYFSAPAAMKNKAGEQVISRTGEKADGHG